MNKEPDVLHWQNKHYSSISSVSVVWVTTEMEEILIAQSVIISQQVCSLKHIENAACVRKSIAVSFIYSRGRQPFERSVPVYE